MKTEHIGVNSENYIFKELMKLSYSDMDYLMSQFLSIIGEEGVDKANDLAYEAMEAAVEYLVSKADECKVSNGEIACMWVIISLSAGLSFLGECEQAAIHTEIAKLDLDFLDEEKSNE